MARARVWALDFARYADASSCQLAGVVPQLRDSLESTGFVVLRDALPARVLWEAASAVRRHVWASGDHHRDALRTTTGRRGWYSYSQTEHIQVNAWNVESPHQSASDLRGAYLSARGYPPSMRQSAELQQANRGGPEVREPCEALWKALHGVAHGALRMIERAYSSRSLVAMHSRSDHTLEFKQYRWAAPTKPAVSSSLMEPLVLLPAHSDLTTITLLATVRDGRSSNSSNRHQRGEGPRAALQAWDFSTQSWVTTDDDDDDACLSLRGDEAPRSGERVSLLLNTGEFARQWSAGRLRSTAHRVVAPPGVPSGDRESVVFFVTPNWETDLGTPGLPPQDPQLGGAGHLPEELLGEQGAHHYGIPREAWSESPLVGDHLPL